jgi:SAM-dependent methyltransferase
LVPLAKAGVRVAGFDPSPEMLAQCRERCAAAGLAVDLSQQRFEDFQYDRSFAAVLVPVGSFTLVADYDTALAVLRRFYAHLAPGGILIIDVPALQALAAVADDRRRWTTPSGDLLTLEGIRTATDWLRQTAETTYRYERWRAGELVQAQIEVMKQRYWGLQELRLALESSGFTEIAASGSYQPREPRPSDKGWTVEARRPAT